jgi:hypothetical protein
MGKRNRSNENPEVPSKICKSMPDSAKKIEKVQQETSKDDGRKDIELEINTFLSSITELRNKVSFLQDKRKNIENNLLGEFDCSISIKKQWKLIKNLRNEGNKSIYTFIDNLRKENKKLKRSLESVESKKCELYKIIEQGQ